MYSSQTFRRRLLRCRQSQCSQFSQPNRCRQSNKLILQYRQRLLRLHPHSHHRQWLPCRLRILSLLLLFRLVLLLTQCGGLKCLTISSEPTCKDARSERVCLHLPVCAVSVKSRHASLGCSSVPMGHLTPSRGVFAMASMAIKLGLVQRQRARLYQPILSSSRRVGIGYAVAHRGLHANL